ncbi:bile acid:Na+ symporter, BASS family [Pseudoalteromonas citrea]|uniref:Bile acid:Na+ symporter, BASS family n=2 Tax=Pseudoalteromonas citrea TaxID=43655 RepID=A0AAD4FRJ5_9GAMM|nr:bile acid:Na+ symporter, BASS family [Pseudoalteromonas citrea]
MVITVFPVIIGMVIRNKSPSLATRAQPYVSGFSIIILALVIISICSKLGYQIFEYIVLAGPAALMLNTSTMLLGFTAGHYLLKNTAQSRTITLEVGLQNGTLALLITTGMLNNTVMSIAPSIYSLLMFFTASLYTSLVLKNDLKSPYINNNRA